MGIELHSDSFSSPWTCPASFVSIHAKAFMKTGNLTLGFYSSDPLSHMASSGEWTGMTRKTVSDQELQSLKEKVTVLLQLQLTCVHLTSSDGPGTKCHQMRLDMVQGMAPPNAGGMSVPYTYTDDD